MCRRRPSDAPFMFSDGVRVRGPIEAPGPMSLEPPRPCGAYWASIDLAYARLLITRPVRVTLKADSMNALLMHPPDEMEAMLGVGKEFIQKYEPLGLLYTAAVAREK